MVKTSVLKVIVKFKKIICEFLRNVVKCMYTHTHTRIIFLIFISSFGTKIAFLYSNELVMIYIYFDIFSPNLIENNNYYLPKRGNYFID